MKRIVLSASLIAGFLLAGAAAANAAVSCTITAVTAPSAGAAVRGGVTIAWSASGCNGSHTVTVAARPSNAAAYRTIASVKGNVVSVAWDTASRTGGVADWPDATTYTLRVSASNTATVGFTVDNTAPSITLAERTPANAAGWNNTAVTVVWSCADATSGTIHDSVSAVVAVDGTDRTASGTCADAAGNTASDTIGGITIDRAAPEIAFVERTAANAHGWNAADVTVTWACADALAGVVAPTVSEVVTAEGAHLATAGTCEDLAGNRASDVHGGIHIDRTSPTIVLDSRTTPNDAGWNAGDVTVVWRCSDALSDVIATTVSETITDEGAGLSASGSCEDRAGHTAPATVTDINIDRTGATAAVDETALAGLLLGGAPVTGDAGDALSGVASVAVTFTDTTGASVVRAASCTGCGTAASRWTVDTTGLVPGVYAASARATDVAGNAGDDSEAVTFVVTG